MKDHTFDARNDEQRARRTKANEPAPDYKVDDSPATQKKAVRQRAKGIAATADAQPGSIAALADATDLAIRAASPAPKKKHPDDVTTKVAKDMKRALAAQEKQGADAPATKPARSNKAAVLKRINAVLAAKSKSPEAATTKAPDDAAAPTTTKPAKVDWLDNGLERTGALTVEALA